MNRRERGNTQETGCLARNLFCAHRFIWYLRSLPGFHYDEERERIEDGVEREGKAVCLARINCIFCGNELNGEKGLSDWAERTGIK